MEEFNETTFKSKVDNVFVKLLSAIMKGNLEEVRHFISNDLYLKFNDYIKELDSKNERQMYDELNVKNTYINSRNVTEEKEIVEVNLISRYMDYVINKDTGDVLRGDDTRRVEKSNTLIFERKLNHKDITLVRRCPACGASISVNTTGKCEYCGAIYDLSNYDYILVAFNNN